MKDSVLVLNSLVHMIAATDARKRDKLFQVRMAKEEAETEKSSCPESILSAPLKRVNHSVT